MFSSVTKRFFSAQPSLITITDNAWNKLASISEKIAPPQRFLFSAEGGGCNGCNYRLKPMSDQQSSTFTKSRIPPTTFTKNHISVVIDPLSEMYLLGTTIDYQMEDINKDIYESKFRFKPDSEIATSCGCGVSFSPR